MLNVKIFITLLAFLMAGLGLIGIFLGFLVNKTVNREGDPVLPVIFSISLFALGLLLSWKLAERYVSTQSRG